MKEISLKEAINIFRQFQNIFHSLSYENSFYYDCECIDLERALYREKGNVSVFNAYFNEVSFYLHRSHQIINGMYNDIPYLSLKIFFNNKIFWSLELKLKKKGKDFVYVAETTSLNIPSLQSLFILTDRELIRKRDEEIRDAIMKISCKYAYTQYENLDVSSLGLEKNSK